MPKNKESRFVSFVLCVGNEQESVADFLQELHRIAEETFTTCEFIVVNNGSRDETVRRIQETAPSLGGGVVLVNLPWRHSLESAMWAGTDLAMGDFVYEIESTYRNWSWDVLITMFEKCVSGFDVVSAAPDQPLKLGSRLFYFMLSKLSYLNLDLTSEELRIVSRRALNAILDAKETTRYRKALYKFSGFPTTILKYDPLDKARSKPDDGLSRRIALAFDILISFSAVGFQLGVIFSFVFFLLSIGIGIFAIQAYIFRQWIAAGWTTLMLFLSCGFSGIFLVMSLLGKYLSIALIELQHRPPYRVSSITRIPKTADS